MNNVLKKTSEYAFSSSDTFMRKSLIGKENINKNKQNDHQERIEKEPPNNLPRVPLNKQALRALNSSSEGKFNTLKSQKLGH